MQTMLPLPHRFSTNQDVLRDADRSCRRSRVVPHFTPLFSSLLAVISHLLRPARQQLQLLVFLPMKPTPFAEMTHIQLPLLRHPLLVASMYHLPETKPPRKGGRRDKEIHHSLNQTIPCNNPHHQTIHNLV